MKGPRGVVVKCQPTKRLPDCTCIKKKTKRLPDCTYIEKKKNDVRTFRKPANRPLVVIATMAQRATLAVERTIDHARGVHQHEGGRGRLGTYLQSHVVYEGWPEVPRPLNNGSPTSAGPSWSTSVSPGAIMVKLSSVGATPAVWTSRPST